MRSSRYDELGDQCLSMYVGGHSYRQIARKLPISKSTVGKYVTRALEERKEARDDLADKYIEQEIERLQQNIRELDKALENLRSGEDWLDGNPRAVKAAKSVMQERRKTGESLRKLLGLDSKERVDITTDGKSLTDPLAGLTKDEKRKALKKRLRQLEATDSAPDDLKGLPGDD